MEKIIYKLSFGKQNEVPHQYHVIKQFNAKLYDYNRSRDTKKCEVSFGQLLTHPEMATVNTAVFKFYACERKEATYWRFVLLFAQYGCF